MKQALNATRIAANSEPALPQLTTIVSADVYRIAIVSTVEIENIHTHLARGEPVARAVLAATREALTPLLLALLSILAVFAPAFFMVGVARSLFIPLALDIGFSMLASYVLATTLVPVLSIWLVEEKDTSVHGPTSFDRIRERYGRWLEKVSRFRWPMLAAYAVIVLVILTFVGRRLGTDIFPSVDAGQVRLRLRAPTGTRIERTEEMALKALDIISDEAGKKNVDIARLRWRATAQLSREHDLSMVEWAT